MGQRSRTETVASVLAALYLRPLWSQAELAREVGVRTETLRTLLEELQASGIPLRTEKQHPHVYWRVPKGWFPGGVLFRQEDVPDLVRQLRRLPRGRMRERLLGIVDRQLSAGAVSASPLVSRTMSEQEDEYGPLVEDAAAKNVSLWMRYFTASRGKPSDRYASVHAIEVGPPVRFVATCHRNGDLRWFRLDGILRAHLDTNEPFRPASPDAVAAFRAASLDGYKGDGPALEHSFFVREPESNWVTNNLLDGMKSEGLADGIRVRTHTSAVLRLARYVVGLGGAARPETPALAAAVMELARGALGQAQAADPTAEIPAASEDQNQPPARPRSDV